jgi:hypothetical protein
MATNGFPSWKRHGTAIANRAYVNNHKLVRGAMLLRKICLPMTLAAALIAQAWVTQEAAKKSSEAMEL